MPCVSFPVCRQKWPRNTKYIADCCLARERLPIVDWVGEKGLDETRTFNRSDPKALWRTRNMIGSKASRIRQNMITKRTLQFLAIFWSFYWLSASRLFWSVSPRTGMDKPAAETAAIDDCFGSSWHMQMFWAVKQKKSDTMSCWPWGEEPWGVSNCVFWHGSFWPISPRIGIFKKKNASDVEHCLLFGGDFKKTIVFLLGSEGQC